MSKAEVRISNESSHDDDDDDQNVNDNDVFTSDSRQHREPK